MVVNLYILGKIEGKNAVAQIIHGVHLITGLKANLLIGMDILGLESVCLDFYKSTAKFPHCKNLEADMKIMAKENGIVNYSVKAAQKTTIPPHTAMEVPVNVSGRKLPENQDFMYQSKIPRGYHQVVNCNLALVMVRNDFSKPRELSKKTLLGFVTELEEPEVYAAHDDNAELTYEPIKEPAMVSCPEDPS